MRRGAGKHVAQLGLRGTGRVRRHAPVGGGDRIVHIPDPNLGHDTSGDSIGAIDDPAGREIKV